MFALTRLPTRTFGVLMSLEPALAALVGFGFLGERLTGWQWAAILSIMLASGGSAATSPALNPSRSRKSTDTAGATRAEPSVAEQCPLQDRSAQVSAQPNLEQRALKVCARNRIASRAAH
jgi:hypothetical protein